MRSILSHLASHVSSRCTYLNMSSLMQWEPVSQLQCTLSVWQAPSLGGALLGCLRVSFEPSASQLFVKYGTTGWTESRLKRAVSVRGKFRGREKDGVGNQEPAESGFWPKTTLSRRSALDSVGQQCAVPGWLGQSTVEYRAGWRLVIRLQRSRCLIFKICELSIFTVVL